MPGSKTNFNFMGFFFKFWHCSNLCVPSTLLTWPWTVVFIMVDYVKEYILFLQKSGYKKWHQLETVSWVWRTQQMMARRGDFQVRIDHFRASQCLYPAELGFQVVIPAHSSLSGHRTWQDMVRVRPSVCYLKKASQ